MTPYDCVWLENDYLLNLHPLLILAPTIVSHATVNNGLRHDTHQ